MSEQKAIFTFETYCKNKLKAFRGNFENLNRIMESSVDSLFSQILSSLFNEEDLREILINYRETLEDSKNRITFLLSTFGDKLKLKAEKFLLEQPSLSDQEIKSLLVMTAVERVKVIARTEVGYLYASVTKNMAIARGQEYFIWETMRDKRVGADHKKLQGKIFKVTDLPIDGYPQRSRPNCRCRADFISLSEKEYREIRKKQKKEGIQYAN